VSKIEKIDNRNIPRQYVVLLRNMVFEISVYAYNFLFNISTIFVEPACGKLDIALTMLVWCKCALVRACVRVCQCICPYYACLGVTLSLLHRISNSFADMFTVMIWCVAHMNHVAMSKVKV
jgi:hypothetical protein